MNTFWTRRYGARNGTVSGMFALVGLSQELPSCFELWHELSSDYAGLWIDPEANNGVIRRLHYVTPSHGLDSTQQCECLLYVS